MRPGVLSLGGFASILGCFGGLNQDKGSRNVALNSEILEVAMGNLIHGALPSLPRPLSGEGLQLDLVAGGNPGCGREKSLDIMRATFSNTNPSNSAFWQRACRKHPGSPHERL